MSESALKIIGLEKEVFANDTGAAAHFHVLRQYSVSLVGPGSSAATFAGFVSQAAFDAGKAPLMHMTVQVTAAPAGDSALFPTWFVERLLESSTPHEFTGARAVYAAPAPPAAEEPAA